jgi:hypothetical protein
MKKNGVNRSSRVVFLVPRIIANSVTFVIYQYVVALRARGIDAVIAAPRSAKIALDPDIVAPFSAIFLCDVLITSLFVPDLIGWLVSRVRRIDWVPFLQCDIIGGMVGERKRFAKWRVAVWRGALGSATRVVTPSRYAAKSLRPVPQLALLPHCLVLSLETQFRAITGRLAPPVADRAQEADPAYVFIGRDTPTKRLRSVLRLLSLDPRARVRLITAIDFSSAAVAALTPDERDRCEIVGFAVDPYAHVLPDDIVVCPSGREGFGMVPLECLARGIACAVIDEGAFHEYWAATSMSYSRIEDLAARRGCQSHVAQVIRDAFIGGDALRQRVDRLEMIIAGKWPSDAVWVEAGLPT